MHLVPLLLTVSALVSSTLAKGINCQGSSACRRANCGYDGKNCLQTIGDFIDMIDESAWYTPGEQIVCSSKSSSHVIRDQPGVCAFVQKLDRHVSGAEVKEAFGRLKAHHCRTCGSVPFDADENDVYKGELTLNYVDSDCGHGVCRSQIGWNPPQWTPSASSS